MLARISLTCAVCASLVVRGGLATPPAPPRFFAYQVREDGGIAAFAVKANGDLSELPYVVKGKVADTTLLCHPVRPVLYAITPVDVVRTDTGDVSIVRCRYRLTVYGVNRDGHLTARQTLVLTRQPTTFSPDGKRLYVPGAPEVQQIYQVAADGTLRATGKTGGAGANVDATNPAGFYDNDTLTFAPRGHFAFRHHAWGMLDTGGVSVQRFRVQGSGQLVKSGPAWGSADAPAVNRWETDTGNFTFAQDGQTVFMDGQSGKVSVLRLDAQGQLHEGKVYVPGKTPGAVWGKGEIANLDRSGRFALLTATSLVPTSTAPPFRIARVTGHGKVRETTRFGAFVPPAAEKLAESTTATLFSVRLRPDNFINATVNNSTPTPYRYAALFHLEPNGTVRTVKPWTKLPEKDNSGQAIPEWAQEPIFRTVFLPRPE